MSLKVLTFGHSQMIGQMLHKIDNTFDQNSQQAVKVQNFQINQKSFLVFTINDRSLISEQATGSNGLIFFLDHQKPLYQQKQFIMDLLNLKRQFDNIPLVVLFQKQQGLNIKDIINYFELFKMKDRTSMIKELNFQEQSSIVDVFQWIQNQSDFRRSRMFDAQPKVVKMKAKYRQTDQQESVKKYQDMLKDKTFRNMSVKDQQKIYITQEKQRIKNQNMEKQLANFNKNKKKMTPYDIKATPNPKIQANLHFFLKDPKNQKQPEVNIKIQTDQFKPKAPQKAYVPKKTGINISTQIEQNQLFDFDKEVKPILNILTIKALQMAVLQIQEEEQFSKIKKYKAVYNQKVRKQKQHQQKMIDEELAMIKKKQKLLQQARKKHQTRKNIKKRVTCYDISSRFLQNIYKKANLNLFNKNEYFDSYQNEIQTQYLNLLISKTANQIQKLNDKQQAIMNVFQENCLEPIFRVSQQPKKLREQLKSQMRKRRVNQSQNQRMIHVYYKDQNQSYSSFSKYIQKNFDGTLDQFVRIKQEQIQQISDKISSGQVGEDQLVKFKAIQNQQFGQSHQSFLIGCQSKLSFNITPNRYQKSDRNLMNSGLIELDKQGQTLFMGFSNKTQFNQKPYLKFANNLRSTKQIVNMDQGIVVDLQNVDEKVKTIIFLSKFNKIDKYNEQAQNKKVKFSSYGIQFYDHGVPIHKQNPCQKIKWDQLIKAPQGQDSSAALVNQSIVSVAYVLTRKGYSDLWNIQSVNHNSKALLDQQTSNYLQEVAKFYSRSLQIFKVQEQQQERPPSTSKKNSRSQKRIKSKKDIQEQKPKKKIIKLSSRIFSVVSLDLYQPFDINYTKLEDIVKQWKEFVQSCEAGWELRVKGKKLQSIDQLKKVTNAKDLCLFKLEPIVQEEEIKKQNQLIEQGQNQND